MTKWFDRLMECRDKYIAWAVIHLVAAREFHEIKNTDNDGVEWEAKFNAWKTKHKDGALKDLDEIDTVFVAATQDACSQSPRIFGPISSCSSPVRITLTAGKGDPPQLYALIPLPENVIVADKLPARPLPFEETK